MYFETDVLEQNIDLFMQLLNFWFLDPCQSHTEDWNSVLAVTSQLLLSLLLCNSQNYPPLWAFMTFGHS